MAENLTGVRAALARCLTDDQLKLGYSELGRILIGYIVPIVAALGISGNLLNLTVLLAKKMRTRSNSLLASLALVDIIFLISFLPECMANHHFFYTNTIFRQFYFYGHVYRLHFQNWFSAAAIWMILIICAERLLGIRNPLSTRTHASIMAPKFLVSFTVVFTGLLTSHYHFTFICKSRLFCNGSQFQGICLNVDSPLWFGQRPNPNSMALRLFARYSLEIQALVIVFLPVLLVIFSNALLLLTLRKRTRFLRIGAGSEAMTSIQIKKEQRVTLTVCAIVTCFTITQAPSAVVPVIATITGSDYITGIIIVATMVVVGKALNFILFCLSSSNFRQRLLFRTKELANNSAIRNSPQGATARLLNYGRRGTLTSVHIPTVRSAPKLNSIIDG
ncbi:unnamed protein product, partial [Mesorhabditis belari]|uniref:G-protein coupled receptors family 1 profile domain-containing protein n=1 Tax=Mesorhabditis belari TaxID=2138241 RepID=A0AAF3ERI1_9BILA